MTNAGFPDTVLLYAAIRRGVVARINSEFASGEVSTRHLSSLEHPARDHLSDGRGDSSGARAVVRGIDFVSARRARSSRVAVAS